MRRTIPLALLALVAGLLGGVAAIGHEWLLRDAAPIQLTPVAHVTAAPPRAVRPASVAVRAQGQVCYVAGQGCSIHPCVEFIAASGPAGPEIVGPGGATRPARPAGGRRCARVEDATSPAIAQVRPAPRGRLTPGRLTPGRLTPGRRAGTGMRALQQAEARAQRALRRHRLTRRPAAAGATVIGG